MADAFIGEIRIFPFVLGADEEPPLGWSRCDGQVLQVKQQSTLFSVLGNTYGGDGVLTFALPDLRARVPMKAGQGEGLSPRALADAGGTETVALTGAGLPLHSHEMSMSIRASDGISPANLSPGTGNALYAPYPGQVISLAHRSLQPVGESAPHNNMQPYLTFCFCIATQGDVPNPN